MMEKLKVIDRANILIEALPYIKEFYDKYIVIKYGGSAMIEDELKESFAIDCTLLKYVGIKPVIVHGGGPLITKFMEKLGIKPKFQDGLRITDKESMEMVEMVLGRINTEIVSLLNKHEAKAVGLSGADGNMILAKPIKKLGFVGEVHRINKELLEKLFYSSFIPVIAPIGVDEKGVRYNINADTVAEAIASRIEADKIIFLTDTKGVLDGERLLSTIRIDEIEGLIKKKKVSSGMIPKVRAAQEAIENGVMKAHIIDGRIKHSILLELFTNKGIGTEIIRWLC
ncbi:MAG: acetylglutamate kinase [bacterium]